MGIYGNLLLLADGNFICDNCTYNCSACGIKIEDLAILTGDQAFCSACFKCRNCKKRIENLKYARTSQGMFCMECHNKLMARRRKKKAKQITDEDLNKPMPSLPPSQWSNQQQTVEIPATATFLEDDP